MRFKRGDLLAKRADPKCSGGYFRFDRYNDEEHRFLPAHECSVILMVQNPGQVGFVAHVYARESDFFGHNERRILTETT